MTSHAHAQAVARWRSRLNAPPKARNEKSAAGTSRDALEAASLLLIVTLAVVSMGFIGITTSRETDRLMQEYSEQLKAQEAGELEIRLLMK